jgi:hypothetical protein
VVFHVSSRRDNRSHAATRVIKTNTNRRHMVGDHHGRAAGRATLLVRAVDEILGTHKASRVAAISDAASHAELLTNDSSESTFATARHRTKITKGPGSWAAEPAMAFKLIESAQDHWRMANVPYLVALVPPERLHQRQTRRTTRARKPSPKPS